MCVLVATASRSAQPGGGGTRAFLIAMTGTDGHRALPSRADTDPDFTLAPVLLAVGVDGTPLDWLRAAVTATDRA